MTGMLSGDETDIYVVMNLLALKWQAVSG